MENPERVHYQLPRAQPGEPNFHHSPNPEGVEYLQTQHEK
jgi:hypothetical protein